MSEKTLREHLKSIASSGGKSLLEKRGRKYFSKLRKDAWRKKKKAKVL